MASRSEVPYGAQKEIVSTLRRTAETPSRATRPAAHEDESHAPKDYRKVLDMMGRSNHAAMQELFLGGGLPPTLSDTAVTVSFEMFQSVQERLVATRTELDKVRESLIVANQRSATMQMQSVADRERVLSVEKKLEQMSDYAQTLRRTNAEQSMTIQSKEGERLRLEEDRSKIRAELTSLTLKHAEVTNELAHTKAMCSRLESQLDSVRQDMKTALDRHAEQLAQAAQQANAAAKRAPGGEMKLAALNSQLAKLKEDLDDAVREKSLEQQNFAAERNRSRRVMFGARRRYEALESTAMQMSESLTHLQREQANMMNLLVTAQSKSAEVDRQSVSLQRLVSMNKRSEEEQTQSLATAFTSVEAIKAAVEASELPREGDPGHGALGLLDAAKDTAHAFASSAVEALRLLCQADRLFGTSSTLAEALEQWIELKRRMTNAISRYAVSGAEGFDAVLHAAAKDEAGMIRRGHDEKHEWWLAKVAAEYRLIMPSADAEVAAIAESVETAVGHDVDAPSASFFSGRMDADANTVITKSPASFSVDQDAWTDVDYKIPDWVMRLPQPPASLQGVPQQLFEDLPGRFASFHQKLTTLTSLLRKRMNIQVAQATDPLSYADRLGVKLDITDCWQVVQLDEDLILAILAAMMQGKDEAIKRLLHHKTRSDLHSNDRTLEKLKSMNKNDRNTKLTFKDRQELSLFKSNRGGMEQDVRGAFFDNNALLLAVQSELEYGSDEAKPDSSSAAAESGLPDFTSFDVDDDASEPVSPATVSVPSNASMASPPPPALKVKDDTPTASAGGLAKPKPKLSFLAAKAVAASSATPKASDVASVARQLLRETSKLTSKSSRNLKASPKPSAKPSPRTAAVKASPGGAAPSAAGKPVVTITAPSAHDPLGSGEHFNMDDGGDDDDKGVTLFTDDDDDAAVAELPPGTATKQTPNTLERRAKRAMVSTADIALQTNQGSFDLAEVAVQTGTGYAELCSASTSPIPRVLSPTYRRKESVTARKLPVVLYDTNADDMQALSPHSVPPNATPPFSARSAVTGAPLATMRSDASAEEPIIVQLLHRGDREKANLVGGHRSRQSPPSAFYPTAAPLQPMPSLVSGTAVSPNSSNGPRRSSRGAPRQAAIMNDDRDATPVVVVRGPLNPLWVMEGGGGRGGNHDGDAVFRTSTSPSRSMSVSGAPVVTNTTPMMVHRMSVSLPMVMDATAALAMPVTRRQPGNQQRASPSSSGSPAASGAASPAAHRFDMSLPSAIVGVAAAAPPAQQHSDAARDPRQQQRAEVHQTTLTMSQTLAPGQRPATVPTRPATLTAGSRGASNLSAEISAALDFAAQIRAARQGPTVASLHLTTTSPRDLTLRATPISRTPGSQPLTPRRPPTMSPATPVTPRPQQPVGAVVGMQFNRSLAAESPEPPSRSPAPPTRASNRGAITSGMPPLLQGIPALAPRGHHVTSDLAALLWPAPPQPAPPSSAAGSSRPTQQQRARGVVAAQRRQVSSPQTARD